mmetsp:Transcript_114950/g.287288  ORF Transcript_114950/g.287288 Transcript_114950/m.287288 type:complete len:294 (+) Transcript_114950:363-1244(+)
MPKMPSVASAASLSTFATCSRASCLLLSASSLLCLAMTSPRAMPIKVLSTENLASGTPSVGLKQSDLLMWSSLASVSSKLYSSLHSRTMSPDDSLPSESESKRLKISSCLFASLRAASLLASASLLCCAASFTVLTLPDARARLLSIFPTRCMMSMAAFRVSSSTPTSCLCFPVINTEAAFSAACTRPRPPSKSSAALMASSSFRPVRRASFKIGSAARVASSSSFSEANTSSFNSNCICLAVFSASSLLFCSSNLLNSNCCLCNSSACFLISSSLLFLSSSALLRASASCCA